MKNKFSVSGIFSIAAVGICVLCIWMWSQNVKNSNIYLEAREEVDEILINRFGSAELSKKCESNINFDKVISIVTNHDLELDLLKKKDKAINFLILMFSTSTLLFIFVSFLYGRKGAR